MDRKVCSEPKLPICLQKLSSQSMSERSSSFRSRDGIDFRREHGANLEGRRDERSWGSSLQNQPSLLSGDSLSDRSRSLKDNQPLSGVNLSPLHYTLKSHPGLTFPFVDSQLAFCPHYRCSISCLTTLEVFSSLPSSVVSEYPGKDHEV